MGMIESFFAAVKGIGVRDIGQQIVTLQCFVHISYSIEEKVLILDKEPAGFIGHRNQPHGCAREIVSALILPASSTERAIRRISVLWYATVKC